MWTLVFLCVVLATHGVRDADATGEEKLRYYTETTLGTAYTDEPSCQYNCGYDMGSCSCSRQCEYSANCCHDYYYVCPTGTAPPTGTEAITPTDQPSCRYNCGYNMGSCSCTSSCEYYGNCCYDYSWHCPSYSTEFSAITQSSCQYNCGSHLGHCSCSSSCEHHGNCCHDYYWYCSSTTERQTTGWTDFYTAYQTAVPCDEYFYSSSGTFYSPNYPNNYHNNARCTWYIRPSRAIVQLEFSDVNIECGYDDIWVYDGDITGPRLLGTYCQANNSIFYSTGRYLTVLFTSDSVVAYSGFRAYYRVVDSCQDNCGYQLGNCSCSSSCRDRGNCCRDYEAFCQTSTVEPTTGQLSCRHNCGSHLGNCSCSSSCYYYGECCHDYHYYCYTTDYPVTAEQSCRDNCGSYPGGCSCYSDCQYYGNCCHDYHTYCGSSTPTESCGGSLFSSGTFSSPNYPSYYSDNSYCVWQLRASHDQRIYLVFTFLQLDTCCSCDYISVYDGPSVNSPRLAKVCNNGSSAFFSTSEYMTVVFQTDSSVVARGFTAEFLSSLKPNSGRTDCSSDSMNIILDRAYLSSLGYDGHSLYLRDPHCRPQISSYNVVFSFPLNTCGNVREVINDRIVYTNNIYAYSSTYGEITRQSQFKMNVTCIMEKDSISQIMYVADGILNTTVTGSGRYNTSMDFYTSGSFYEKVTTFPYEVALNEYLFVQVDLRRGDSTLVLFIDTCVTSPSPFDFHSRSYFLVKDGCPVDNTYYSISSGARPYARFRFKAFQFLRATDKVYMQCKVLICPASDYNSRCRRGCRRRSKRSLGSNHDTQTLVVGPIKLRDLKDEEGAEKLNEA